MKNVAECLRRVYEGVVNHKPKSAKEISYAKAPPGALVTNKLSGRAEFGNCVLRRVGYIVQVSAEDLARLNYWSQPLSDQRRKWMQHAWTKGVIWSPLYTAVSLEGDRFVINSVKDYDICLFLAEHRPSMMLQVVETGRHSKATKVKLELLKQGLYLRSGARCPVLVAGVTL